MDMKIKPDSRGFMRVIQFALPEREERKWIARINRAMTNKGMNRAMTKRGNKPGDDEPAAVEGPGVHGAAILRLHHDQQAVGHAIRRNDQLH